MPTIEAWLQGAIDDVVRSSLPSVRPVLEALGQAAAALRGADWNADASRDEDRRATATTPLGRRG